MMPGIEGSVGFVVGEVGLVVGCVVGGTTMGREVVGTVTSPVELGSVTLLDVDEDVPGGVVPGVEG